MKIWSAIFEKFNELYNENRSPETYYENLIYDIREHYSQDILTEMKLLKKSKKKKKCKENGLIVFSKELYQDLSFKQKQEMHNISSLEHSKFLKLKKMKMFLNLIKNLINFMRI